MEEYTEPSKYEATIEKEAPMKTYSYQFEKKPTLVYGANGYIYPDTYADYKLVEDEDTYAEVVRRGDTTYYAQDKITKDVQNADLKIIKQIMENGLYPDGTRRHVISSPPWEWDHYQTLKIEYQLQQENASPSMEKTVANHPGVDYHYFNTDYLLNTGNTKLLTMNANCIFEDGSRLPADRPAELRNKHFTDKFMSFLTTIKKQNRMCC